MTYTLYHILASVIVALIFGVAIDLDHGIHRDSGKCAASIRLEDCLEVGQRGVFHDFRFWGLFVCGMVAWTVHLFMDGLVVGAGYNI